LLLAGALYCAGQDQVPVGGRWFRAPYKDPATDRRLVSFSLEPDRADFDRRPVISIVCTGSGKAVMNIYRADFRLTPEMKDRLNYDVRAMPVWLRVDNHKIYKAIWDLLPDKRSAVIDDKTAKHLLTGSRLRVRIGSFVDTFSIGGLDRREIHEACGDSWFKTPPLDE
jgi:hypothetical protein